MTTETLIHVALVIIMGLCGTVFVFWTREQDTLRKAQDKTLASLDKRFTDYDTVALRERSADRAAIDQRFQALTDRLDKHGHDASKRESMVQGLLGMEPKLRIEIHDAFAEVQRSLSTEMRHEFDSMRTKMADLMLMTNSVGLKATEIERRIAIVERVQMKESHEG